MINPFGISLIAITAHPLAGPAYNLVEFIRIAGEKP
jgi:hypothetical protein